MTTDLWAGKRERARQQVAPLAVRMRPGTLDEFVGQAQFLAPGKLLRRMLDADRLTSLIFFGPPGTGKTTLAEVIANHTQCRFERANAAMIGVKEIRRIIDEAIHSVETGGKRTILFLDEIHRFNKAQQDVLLNDVERGLITLIGATTENPYFAVNSALVSRSTVLRFEALSTDEILTILRHAINDNERGYGGLDLTIDDAALEHWAIMSDGDARRALTALEIAVLSSGTVDPERSAEESLSQEQPIHLTLEIAQESIQRKALVYDGDGDAHYDVISAFIKSMRGSDPDAAVYYLARMLEAGEDPRFIARRIAILASEDIGNADPRAIQIAAAAFEITERIGMPECQLTLAQAAIFMSVSPKSNASAKAIWEAMKDVREGRTVEVPAKLRDAHYPAAKSELGHGEGYQYAHDYEGGIAPGQQMGISKKYYHPTQNGLEQRIAERLREIRTAHGGRSAQSGKG